ncbi:MAG: hypothetical protein IIA65_05335, partial [Planctomycetes bacterium]|nr:hypothetical protein [Planctomycetota bacterium]
MGIYKLNSPYRPSGDQPQAIAKLSAGIKQGTALQTLMGVTGSGKTFTMANLIADHDMPTLVISHNNYLFAEIEQKQEESELEAQVAMARANLDAQVKLIIEKIRAGEKVNLEQVKVSLQNDPIERETESILQTKSAVDSLKEQLVGAVKELQEAASAEKDVVR